MPGPNRIDLEFGARDAGAISELDKLRQKVADLESLVEMLSGKPLNIPTDPAEASIKKLAAEFNRLEKAFDRAEKSLSFARARNEIERTAVSARRLANAEAVVAARGKELISFAQRLPPELRKSAGEMDRLERETEQATAAFRQFQATTKTTGAGLSKLLSSIGSLKAGLAALIAALGVQQLIRYGRALVDLGQSAVETKIQFDRLIPGLKAFAGSTQLANEIAERLGQTADKLKTPLAGLVDPFLAIQAGGREAGLAIAEINSLFDASLESARAFGKGASDVQRLLTGISQVAGKGVASMEEFRQQIGEAIPNAIPALAKGLGEAEGRLVTTAEAIARISSGSLDSATALRALTVGFERLNSEAAKGQLDTLAGDIGNIERVAEKAEVALADGLEPGLRSLLQAAIAAAEGNEDLIKSIGGIASAGLDQAAQILKLANALKVIINASEESKKSVREFFDAVGAGVAFVAKIPGLEEAFRNIGNALTGLTAEADAAFERIEKRQRQLVLGSNQSAEDILETFKKSFREQAEAAGVAAQEIEQTEKDLADEVGKIQEKGEKAREALRKVRVAAERGSVEEIQAIEKLAAETILQLEKDAAAARDKLLKELVQSARRASEERIRLEAEAAAKIREEAEGITIAAKKVAEQRIKIDQEAADRIAEIEAELAEKIIKLQEEFIEKVSKPKADREKLQKELLDKIVEAERDAASKIEAEQERIAKAAEKAAERRRKAEEKVQEARRKSLDQLAEIVERLNDVAAGGEGAESSALEKTKEDVDALDESLNGLLVTLDQLNAGDLGNPLDDVAESGLDLLGGGAAADFFSKFGSGASEAAESVDDFGETLREITEATQGLSKETAAAVLELVKRYSDLAEAGRALPEDARAFADELARIFEDLGTSLDDPVQALLDRIEELRQKQEEAASTAQETGETYKEAGETAGVAWDPVTRRMESVEKATDGVGDSAEELVVKWENVDGVLTATQVALEDTKESGEAAAEGLEAAGEAGAEAAKGIAEAGKAAEELKGEIVAEGEPDKLRDLGAAAGEALPSIEPLAEPVASLAEASAAIAEALPIISEHLPVVAEVAATLLAALGESDVDLSGLAEQVAALAAPIEAISTTLPVIAEVVKQLPEPLERVQAAAEPFFDLVAGAAEDDRFGILGQGLGTMREALSGIPEPLERAQEALAKLADRRDEISETLQSIADGLGSIASEEVLGGLEGLITATEEVFEILTDISTTTTEWKTTLDAITADMPALLLELEGLAERARSDVAPGMDRAAESTRLFDDDLDALGDTADSTLTETKTLVDEVTASLAEATAQALELVNALLAVEAAARQAAAAAKEVSLPS